MCWGLNSDNDVRPNNFNCSFGPIFSLLYPVIFRFIEYLMYPVYILVKYICYSMNLNIYFLPINVIRWSILQNWPHRPTHFKIRQFWSLHQIFCLKYGDTTCFKWSFQRKFLKILLMLIFSHLRTFKIYSILFF